jgi:transcriptional regulator with XRE-family HTH domain
MNAIKTAILCDGRNQASIARGAGISPSHFCRVLKGERKLSRRALKKLARVLGVRVEDLTERAA